MKLLTALLGCWLLTAAGTLKAEDDLAARFVQPSDSAKPWVYWFVMDGNQSREGITADFEALKRVGIGGVLFMEVDVGIPKGPVKFMSPAWRELFRHANAEAARLGLVMTMPASPGWTGSGGPWVKPAESMQKLVWSETNLVGPQHFSAALSQPEAVAGFFRDVAVLAFPTPPEVYRIEGIAEKALYRRGHYSSEAGVKALLPSPAQFPQLRREQVISKDAMLDLTDKLDGAGRLTWDMPPGNWTLLRLGHTSTGANTRPAPEPGVGLECDKFNKEALAAHFENFLGKLLRDIGPLAGKSLVSLHIDSWEMGPQNWTARFPQEFEQRRGYDLRRYLPVMTGRVVDSLEISERFLWDLRQTALELIADCHAGYLAELAHQRGLGLSIEPYDGTPCDDMTYGARADTPMGEVWRDTFQTWFSCTEASSIAHTYGKRIVQAEAFTSGDGERWLAHPATLKTLGDWAYCEGINRLVFHRCAHQPWLDRWPGMTMGPYGIHYDRTQTWFEQSKAWIEYLTRCQVLLQQGLSVADVCFLKPEASPQVFRAPASAVAGMPPDRLGYNFDALTPEALVTRMSVRDGRLMLPDGMSYRVLALSQQPTMTPSLLRKLKELVAAGGTIVGPPPQKSPSLSGYPGCDQEVKALVEEVWGGCDGSTVTEHSYGLGHVVWHRSHQASDVKDDATPETYGSFEVSTALLQRRGVPPDFESSGPFRYAHRQVGLTDIYFVANREEGWAGADCTFRVAGKTPELWDPRTGQITTAAVFYEKDGRMHLPICLEPAGSVFVVFRQPDSSPATPRMETYRSVRRDGESVLPALDRVLRQRPPIELLGAGAGGFQLMARSPGRYECETSSGKTISVDIETVPAAQRIDGPWGVQFQPNRGAPEQLRLPQLIDLSTHPDPGVRFYSGTAAYQHRFVLAPALAGPDRRIYLELGDVQVMAQVRLNGQDLGVVWKAPFELDITESARSGENTLEITVANLWVNRLIGDQGLTPDKRVAWTTWNPFSAGTPLRPSGLLGPVTLRAAVVRSL